MFLHFVLTKLHKIVGVHILGWLFLWYLFVTEKKKRGDCVAIWCRLSHHLYAFAAQNDSFYHALGLRLHNNPLAMAYAS